MTRRLLTFYFIFIIAITFISKPSVAFCEGFSLFGIINGDLTYDTNQLDPTVRHYFLGPELDASFIDEPQSDVIVAVSQVVTPDAVNAIQTTASSSIADTISQAVTPDILNAVLTPTTSSVLTDAVTLIQTAIDPRDLYLKVLVGCKAAIIQNPESNHYNIITLVLDNLNQTYHFYPTTVPQVNDLSHISNLFTLEAIAHHIFDQTQSGHQTLIEKILTTFQYQVNNVYCEVNNSPKISYSDARNDVMQLIAYYKDATGS